MSRTLTVDDWQVSYDERAAILEYEAGLPREEAEKQALIEIYDQSILCGVQYPGILTELVCASRQRFDSQLASTVDELGLNDVRAPLWGLDVVMAERDTYCPALGDEPGRMAFIAPATEEGSLVDLIAQSLASGKMLSRLGMASVIGADEIEISRAHDLPLLIFVNAMSWLRGGCRGAVIVNWQEAGRSLDGVSIILCPTSIAAHIYKATRKCWPVPKIGVPESEVRHAA